MRAWVKAAALALLPVVLGVAGAGAVFAAFLAATGSLGSAICLTATALFGAYLLFAMVAVAALVAVNMRDIHDEICTRGR